MSSSTFRRSSSSASSTKDRQVRPGSRIAFDYKPRSPRRAAIPHFRWFLLALGVTLACGVAGYLLNRHPPAWLTQTSIVAPTLTAQDLPPAEPWRLVIP